MKTDSQEWILRTMRRILAESGPKAARRFLDSRGGPARYELAARELARHTVAQQLGSFSSHLYQARHIFVLGLQRFCNILQGFKMLTMFFIFWAILAICPTFFSSSDIDEACGK